MGKFLRLGGAWIPHMSLLGSVELIEKFVVEVPEIIPVGSKNYMVV